MAGDEETPVVTRPYTRGMYVASGSQLAIEKWNGDKDFEKWRWRMKAVLMRNEVHPVVFAPEELRLTFQSRKGRRWKNGRLLLYN